MRDLTKREREILALVAEHEPDGPCYLVPGFRQRCGIVLHWVPGPNARRVDSVNWNTIRVMEHRGLVVTGDNMRVPDYEERVRGEVGWGYTITLTDQGRAAVTP